MITLTGRFPAPLAITGRLPAPLVIAGRFPPPLVLTGALAIAPAAPGQPWALDFSNPDFSGLAALIFEDF